jgi:DNA-directed RNA polymerase subunit RPC12/RpoP
MKPQTKFATCSYCGSRTILKPTARGGHELACASCGAPLHEIKAMPLERLREPDRRKQPYKRHSTRPRNRRYKNRTRKSLWQKGFEELFDAVEDIFD